MATFIAESLHVHVPAYVRDLPSFLRWAESDEFPEEGQICWFNDEVWIDMSMEQLYSHIQVKDEFTFVLRRLAKESRSGRYFSDGLLLSNPIAGIAVKPDGTFILKESLEDGSVRRVEGKEGGYVRIEGTPDMVLEIVSEGSVEKDTVTLVEDYWKAGITEYWIVDVRKDHIDFAIMRRGAKGYEPVRKSAGWVKSSVFGKSFKLTQQRDEAGDPDYELAVK